MRCSHALVLSLAAFVVGVACGSPPPASDGLVTAAAPASPAPDAPRPTPPTATLPDGTTVRLELALTPEERRQGLMFRPSLPEDRGMLLLFDQTGIWSLWMKNTLVPLDMVFLDEAGVVADVTLRAQPCAEEPCPQYAPREPVRAVLELPAGTAARRGVEIGHRIELRGVPGFPAREVSESPSEPGS